MKRTFKDIRDIDRWYCARGRICSGRGHIQFASTVSQQIVAPFSRGLDQGSEMYYNQKRGPIHMRHLPRMTNSLPFNDYISLIHSIYEK